LRSLCICKLSHKRHKYPFLTQRDILSNEILKFLISLHRNSENRDIAPRKYRCRILRLCRDFLLSREIQLQRRRTCIGKTTAQNVHRSGMPHDTFTPVRTYRALDTYVIAMISHRGWRLVAKRARFSLYSYANVPETSIMSEKFMPLVADLLFIFKRERENELKEGATGVIYKISAISKNSSRICESNNLLCNQERMNRQFNKI